MRTYLLPCLLLLLLAASLPVRAQAVYHCVDGQGHPLFSDQPCSAQAATQVQAPAAASAPAPNAPMPLQRCAASAEDLRQQVIAAFAARDPNRLAGLMLWHGYGHTSAVADVRSLAQLVQQPLLDVQLGDAAPASAASSGAPADTLQVQTSGAGASFAISRDAGCYWLRYTD